MRAIKQASATEQREKVLTQQRKANRLPLACKEDLRAAAAAVANGWMLPQGPGHIFCSSSLFDEMQLLLTRRRTLFMQSCDMICWVFTGKSQISHKKQGSKAPAPVTTGNADLPVEDVDLLTGIDMTLLHRFALPAACMNPTMHSAYPCQKIELAAAI